MKQAVLACLLLCSTAAGADFALNAGGTHRGGGALDLRYETSDNDAEGYLTAGVFIAGPHEHRKLRIDANGGPYVMATWGERLRAGAGLIYLANTSPVHGSHVNAILTAGVYGKRYHAYWLHVSNAGLVRPNYGYDALMVGVRW